MKPWRSKPQAGKITNRSKPTAQLNDPRRINSTPWSFKRKTIAIREPARTAKPIETQTKKESTDRKEKVSNRTKTTTKKCYNRRIKNQEWKIIEAYLCLKEGNLSLFNLTKPFKILYWINQYRAQCPEYKHIS